VNDKQQKWFHSILLSISEAAIVVDERGKVNLLNSPAEMLTGWKLDEARGKELADFFYLINEDARVEVENRTKTALQEGRAVELSDNLLLTRRDGTKRHISGNIMPVCNDAGEITGAVLLIRNEPTEHEKFGMHGKSEEHLRVLVENAPVAIAMFDRSMRYIATSRRWLTDYGLTDTHLIGRSHYDVFPEILEYWKAAHQRGPAGEVQMSNEDRFVRKNGTVQWLQWELRPWHAADGSVGGIVIFTIDITEHIRSKEQLQESETRLRSAELLAKIGHFTFDEAGSNYQWSDGVKKIWGFDIEETPSFNDFVQRMHPEDRDDVIAEFKKSGQEKRDSEMEYRVVRSDGSVATVYSMRKFIYDKEKDLPIFFGTLVDITDQKLAEKEQADLQNQLQQAQKMESIGRLAGGIAHDFNNMLSIIIGYTELAIEKIDASKSLHSDLMEIFNAANRSANLTKQLLAFARKQTITPKIIDLNNVIGDMLKMLHRLIGENIDLTWIPGDNLGLVKMDPAQVDQILANLCVNARDAISGVGKITIETSNVTLDEAYCAQHPGFLPGSYIMIAVSDNGYGMNPETLSNIFEPYFSTKHAGKGSGLGLSIVYGVVKQNEGNINVYSEPGQGTTFKIYLSRHTAEGKANIIKSPDQVAQGGSEKILFVEDEPMILNLGRRMLKSLGYHVLATNSPTDALSLAKAHPETIDLLITDVVMPEMNGRDLAEQIKVIIPDLKILYISGYTADVIANHGVIEEGVILLPKPFSLLELATKIREAIMMKRSDEKEVRS